MAESSQKLITFKFLRKLPAGSESPADGEYPASVHAFVANLDLSTAVEKITFQGPIMVNAVEKDRAYRFAGTATYDRIEQKIYFQCWGDLTNLDLPGGSSEYTQKDLQCPKVWGIDKYLALSSSEEVPCFFIDLSIGKGAGPRLTGAVLSSKTIAIGAVFYHPLKKRYQPYIFRKGTDGRWPIAKIRTANPEDVPSDATNSHFVGVPAEDPTYVHFICSSRNSGLFSLDIYSLKATLLTNLASDKSIIWQQFKIAREVNERYRTLVVYDQKNLRYKLYILNPNGLFYISVTYVYLRKDGSVDSMTSDLKWQEAEFLQIRDSRDFWKLKDALVWEDRYRDSRKVILLLRNISKKSDFAWVGDINPDGSFAAASTWRLIPTEYPGREDENKVSYPWQESEPSVIVESEYV